MPCRRGLCAWCLVVRRAGAAQQPDRAAPHTGVPEIGAALSGRYADAIDCAQGQFEYRKRWVNGRLADVWRMVLAGTVPSAWHLYGKLACSHCFISAASSFTYSLKRFF